MEGTGTITNPHWVECRRRIIHALSFLGIIFLVLYPFANDLYQALATPLTALLPGQQGIIATQVTAPFLVPLKTTLFIAFLLSVPFLLFQLWRFIAPGLFSHEKRLAGALLFSSIFLFYSGISFAYYLVMPVVFGFLKSITPANVLLMPDMNQYLSFIFKMFIAFGVAFEVPVATFILLRTGIVTPDLMRSLRPYILIGSFVLGMLLTPPDVISQVLLAVPMYGLFELGLWFGSFQLSKKARI